MSNILVFNVPATGHINPTLPVIAELTRRGHTVTYMLSEGHRAKIEATGAAFRPYADIPDDYFERAGLNGSTPARTAHVLLNTARRILPELLAVIEEKQPEVIMFDSMCAWGWLAAQVADIPSVSSMSLLVLTPGMMLKAGGILPMMQLGMRSLTDLRLTQATANAVRRETGIKMARFPEMINATGTITLNYTSALFQPGSERLDPSIKFVGPSIETRPHDTSFPFEKLDGRPLIYISLGTVINENSDFFQQCINFSFR